MWQRMKKNTINLDNYFYNVLDRESHAVFKNPEHEALWYDFHLIQVQRYGLEKNLILLSTDWNEQDDLERHPRDVMFDFAPNVSLFYFLSQRVLLFLCHITFFLLFINLE